MLNPSVTFATAMTFAVLLWLFPTVPSGLAVLLLASVLLYWRPALWWALLFGFLIGICCCYAHYSWWQQRAWPAADDKARVESRFYLSDFIKTTDRGWLVVAKDTQGRKLRLHWSATEPPQYDCDYHATVQLSRPRGLLNNGLFDFEAWLLSQRFHASGSVLGKPVCEPRQVAFWLGWRLKIAQWLDDRADSERVKATLNGLLIGNYADLARSDWQQLRESGTIHLLSVSGLHIALVAGLIGWLVLRLCRYSVRLTLMAPAAIWAATAALLVATAYSFLAGFSVPTQRSLVMVAAGCVAINARGRWPWSQAFAWAMIAVLLLNPFAVLSVGFWFSFSATVMVLLAAQYRLSTPRLSIIGQGCQGINALLKLQLLLFAAMLPLLFYSYGRVYWLSLPMNLLAVPWVSFISLPLAFAATALLPVSSTVANFIMDIAAISLQWYWQALDWATHSSVNHFLQAQQQSLWQVVLAWLAIAVWLTLPKQWPPKHVLLIVIVPLLWPWKTSWQAGELRLHFLDVGQGLAILMFTENHTLLYDTGNRYSSSFDVGRDIVVPSIELAGRDHLDAIVISHIDSDHAAGLPAVLERFPAPVYAIDPEGLVHKFALQTAEPPRACALGQRWQFDGVSISVVSPAQDEGRVKNTSCVLLIETGFGRVLLTGDMERGQELRLVDSGAVVNNATANLPLVAISAPHHGSNTSSSASLLAALQPRVAVISAGYLNRYRHPTAKVLARYEQYNVAYYNTADLGQLRLTLNSRGVQWTSALCEDRSLWRRWRREQASLCDTSANFFK